MSATCLAAEPTASSVRRRRARRRASRRRQRRRAAHERSRRTAGRPSSALLLSPRQPRRPRLHPRSMQHYRPSTSARAPTSPSPPSAARRRRPRPRFLLLLLRRPPRKARPPTLPHQLLRQRRTLPRPCRPRLDRPPSLPPLPPFRHPLRPSPRRPSQLDPPPLAFQQRLLSTLSAPSPLCSPARPARASRLSISRLRAPNLFCSSGGARCSGMPTRKDRSSRGLRGPACNQGGALVCRSTKGALAAVSLAAACGRSSHWLSRPVRCARAFAPTTPSQLERGDARCPCCEADCALVPRRRPCATPCGASTRVRRASPRPTRTASASVFLPRLVSDTTVSSCRALRDSCFPACCGERALE